MSLGKWKMGWSSEGVKMRSKNNCLPFAILFSLFGFTCYRFCYSQVLLYFFFLFFFALFVLFIPAKHIKIGINKDVLWLGYGEKSKEIVSRQMWQAATVAASHHPHFAGFSDPPSEFSTHKWLEFAVNWQKCKKKADRTNKLLRSWV